MRTYILELSVSVSNYREASILQLGPIALTCSITGENGEKTLLTGKTACENNSIVSNEDGGLTLSLTFHLSDNAHGSRAGHSVSIPPSMPLIEDIVAPSLTFVDWGEVTEMGDILDIKHSYQN